MEATVSDRQLNLRKIKTESTMGSPGGDIPEDALPPPPPVLPPDFVPERVSSPPPVTPQDSVPERVPSPKGPPKQKRVPMQRPGLGKNGSRISLRTNHFKVTFGNTDQYFFHYSVTLKYEDDTPVEGKGSGRRVIDKMQRTYASELGGKEMAYDGEKSLFTFGPLPKNKDTYTVVVDDMSSKKPDADGNASPGDQSPGEAEGRRRRAKTFKVEINFAAKIPIQVIRDAMRGRDTEDSQEAFRVLDIILRQRSAKEGCLIVRQSFFRDDPNNFASLGGGVMGCRGFHSSFRTTQDGLSLNMDVSTTMIVRPGPLIDFLIENQNARHPSEIDWVKAKRMLKNLRIVTRPKNMEFKITGLSELPCNQQRFVLGRGRVNPENDEEEITVTQYFINKHQIHLEYSDNLPCVNVGRPRRPTYFPIELCSLLPLQRYTKSLTVLQRSSLVEKSRQKPQERMKVLGDALSKSGYNSDPLLRACGITISSAFTAVEGRVLQPPKLKLGGEDLFPRGGRWNLINKRLYESVSINRWAVVNFSARCDVRRLIQDLVRCGQIKGITVDEPFEVIEESPSMRRAPPTARVDDMFEQIKTKLPGIPRFLLCLLPERKNCSIYGPWKKKNLADFGIVTQCMAPTRVNDQYLSNLLLKMNAKLGGLNSLLCIEHSSSIPIISKVPTLILGMDVSHGSPGHSDASIAAVVSSRQWPLISRYRAAVRAQSSRVEMIDSLFKPVGDTDEGIVRELLVDFYMSSGKRKPEQIIIFRDGVSESQFNQVLNIELNQIIEACKYLDEKWSPKFTLIIAQKNHHTKFFQEGSPDNVPAGTVIDNTVCHPRNFDFYMCAHAGMIGTTRPTHYHILHDEIGFSADDMQELVLSLSYVYQRSTTAISIVAPISYAHLAATQVSTFAKFDDASETSSSHGGVTSAGSIPVQELPRMHENVSSSMYFC